MSIIAWLINRELGSNNKGD